MFCSSLAIPYLTVSLSDPSHFGSDTAGINTTRRYLCEALSFQYRYIPIGLLERLPARINDRAPAFRGRNELGEQGSLLSCDIVDRNSRLLVVILAAMHRKLTC
jgi:hypothetical protein